MGMQKCFSMFFGGLKCHIRWGCPGQEVESQLKDVQQCLGVTQPCVLPTRVRSSWVGNKHSKIQFYMGVNIYIYIYSVYIYICIYTVYIYIYARIYSIHIHIHIYIYVWICGMWFINNCELGFSSRYLWGFVLLLQCRTRHYCSGCERRYYFVFLWNPAYILLVIYFVGRPPLLVGGELIIFSGLSTFVGQLPIFLGLQIKTFLCLNRRCSVNLPILGYWNIPSFGWLKGLSWWNHVSWMTLHGCRNLFLAGRSRSSFF